VDVTKWIWTASPSSTLSPTSTVIPSFMNSLFSCLWMCVLIYFSFVCLHVCAYAFKFKVHCGGAFEPGASRSKHKLSCANKKKAGKWLKCESLFRSIEDPMFGTGSDRDPGQTKRSSSVLATDRDLRQAF